MSVNFYLGPNSGTWVQLYPEWNFAKSRRQDRTDKRSEGDGSGTDLKLWSYIWGEYDSIKFSCSWVPASDASLVNSWWESGAELQFFINSDTGWDVTSCKITNKSTPFDKFNPPYVDLYKGKIELEGY